MEITIKINTQEETHSMVMALLQSLADNGAAKITATPEPAQVERVTAKPKQTKAKAKVEPESKPEPETKPEPTVETETEAEAEPEEANPEADAARAYIKKKGVEMIQGGSREAFKALLAETGAEKISALDDGQALWMKEQLEAIDNA